MKLIVGGMPRTSTVSITSALRQMGLTPYDYFVRLQNGHLPRWNRMLKAKCEGSRQALDREQLDLLTSDYDVSAATPALRPVLKEFDGLNPDAQHPSSASATRLASFW